MKGAVIAATPQANAADIATLRRASEVLRHRFSGRIIGRLTVEPVVQTLETLAVKLEEKGS
jgi:hypothetical protein